MVAELVETMDIVAREPVGGQASKVVQTVILIGDAISHPMSGGDLEPVSHCQGCPFPASAPAQPHVRIAEAGCRAYPVGNCPLPYPSLAFMGSALENATALHLLCFVWTSMTACFMIGCLRRRR
jgi:hypothetical protein